MRGRRRSRARTCGWCAMPCGYRASRSTDHAARQRALKADIIGDAFARIGKHTLAAAVIVAPSPADGYRMRARLHVREGRIGFYREGTHDLCDAGATRQLHISTLTAVSQVVDG